MVYNLVEIMHLKSCITCVTIWTMEGVQFMPLQFKVDVLEALKEKGYTTYTLRKNNILSQSTIQKLREGKGVAWENIERFCMLLNCQPGDILEYRPDIKNE